MLIVGLTGGVGSGKSTVADALARRGAAIIDADLVAREVVEPGTLGLAAITARFSRQYIKPDGTLDRRALGQRVFGDEDALADLNGIVHPLVREIIEQRVHSHVGTDDIVVLVVPLLVESGQYRTDVTVVVDVPEDVAIRRLLDTRGWTERESRRRIAAQATREHRRAAADFIIDNTGTPEELEEQVDALWKNLVDRAAH